MADHNTRRDAVLVVAAIGLPAVFVALLTWFLVQLLVPSDPRDPLTKAGGLRPEQDIHRNK
jgi:hypothetical protein